MSYVRVSPSLEYDPIKATLRDQSGKERPAGFAACQFNFMEEVQKQLRAAETPAPKPPQNGAPVSNPGGYSGPAAQNRFYTTPLNPLREGYVQGYDDWFQTLHVVNQNAGKIHNEITRDYCANAAGAQEALRIVQAFEPGATLGSSRFGSGGGPFLADGDYLEVVLPGGARMNAGAILSNYYYGGGGANAASDVRLRDAIALAKRLAPETA